MGLAYNPHLPRLVRAAVVDLVHVLFLDRCAAPLFPPAPPLGPRKPLFKKKIIYPLEYYYLHSTKVEKHLDIKHLTRRTNYIYTAVMGICFCVCDRFPQLHSSGRPKLPEELWVYSMDGADRAKGPKARSSEAASALVTAPRDGTPLVRPHRLADDTSLPTFALDPNHVLAHDPDPFNSFPSHFKFFLLRNLGNQYMQSFGRGTVVHAHRDENVLASSVSSLIASLLSFGFQSSLPKFQELVPVLVRALDGRSDVERMVRPRKTSARARARACTHASTLQEPAHCTLNTPHTGR